MGSHGSVESGLQDVCSFEERPFNDHGYHSH